MLPGGSRNTNLTNIQSLSADYLPLNERLCPLSFPENAKSNQDHGGINIGGKVAISLEVQIGLNEPKCQHSLLGVTFKEHLSNNCVLPSNH